MKYNSRYGLLGYYLVEDANVWNVEIFRYHFFVIIAQIAFIFA